MPRKNLITLPDDVNPGGLITFRKASEISGIPLSTLYEWRRTPGIGLRVYKIRKKIFLRCDEFIAWINRVAVEASIGRFTFESESEYGRSKERSRRLHV